MTTDVPDRVAKLHRLVDQVLLRPSSGSAHNFFIAVKDAVYQDPDLDWNRDRAAVLEYWWHLAVVEAVALSTAGGSMGSPVDDFILTARGRDLLTLGMSSPHDPLRYLSGLREKTGEPDPVALSYLEEALQAWAMGLYRSATVMVGCACERLILLLVEAVAKADIPPWSARLAQALERAATGAPTPVTQLFTHVRDALVDPTTKKRLAGSLGEAVDRYLTPVFEHARGLRNTAGHPTVVEVSRDEAQSVLLLFPVFHEVVSRVQDALAAEPPG